MGDWLGVARRPAIVMQSLRVAAVVGTVLVAINHGDKLVTQSVAASDWLKMTLTYCVPYCVSTYASVSTVMRSRLEAGGGA